MASALASSTSLPTEQRSRLSISNDLELQKFDSGVPTPCTASELLQGVETLEAEPTTDRKPGRFTISTESMLVLALSWNLFTWGWSDGTLGPLLPRIQETYGLTYTTVSMLFVSGCVGNIVGSCSVMWLADRIGLGKILVLTTGIESVAYAVLSIGPPFPVMCVAYAFNGFALATSSAQAQTFVASLPKDTSTDMGILLSFYGLGALCAPLISTQFAQMKRWSFHFLVSDAIAVIGVVISLAVFRLRRQEHFIPPPPVLESAVSGPAQTQNKYKLIFRQRVVHFMAVFLLIYVGVEVSIGGWIVTYLIQRRGGGPSSGYVSSGFFGGLMLGRLCLLPVTKKIGRKHVVYLYSVLVIGLQATIWSVPSLIENAVAVSFVGLLLGPIYPVGINEAASILPKWLLAGAIGWIGAFAQAGGALFPFTTGALANKYGVQALQPLVIALMVVQTVLWFFVTHSKPSRTE